MTYYTIEGVRIEVDVEDFYKIPLSDYKTKIIQGIPYAILPNHPFRQIALVQLITETIEKRRVVQFKDNNPLNLQRNNLEVVSRGEAIPGKILVNIHRNNQGTVRIKEEKGDRGQVYRYWMIQYGSKLFRYRVEEDGSEEKAKEMLHRLRTFDSSFG